MGLGLTHKVFDRTNAMLALSSKLKFSAKDITDYRGGFLLKDYLLKNDTEYISPLPTETASLPEEISISLER